MCWTIYVFDLTVHDDRNQVLFVVAKFNATLELTAAYTGQETIADDFIARLALDPMLRNIEFDCSA